MYSDVLKELRNIDSLRGSLGFSASVFDLLAETYQLYPDLVDLVQLERGPDVPVLDDKHAAVLNEDVAVREDDIAVLEKEHLDNNDNDLLKEVLHDVIAVLRDDDDNDAVLIAVIKKDIAVLDEDDKRLLYKDDKELLDEDNRKLLDKVVRELLDKDDKDDQEPLDDDAAVLNEDAAVLNDDAAVLDDNAWVLNKDVAAGLDDDETALVNEDVAVVGEDVVLLEEDVAVLDKDDKDDKQLLDKDDKKLPNKDGKEHLDDAAAEVLDEDEKELLASFAVINSILSEAAIDPDANLIDSISSAENKWTTVVKAFPNPTVFVDGSNSDGSPSNSDLPDPDVMIEKADKEVKELLEEVHRSIEMGTLEKVATQRLVQVIPEVIRRAAESRGILNRKLCQSDGLEMRKTAAKDYAHALNIVSYMTWILGASQVWYKLAARLRAVQEITNDFIAARRSYIVSERGRSI